MGSLLVETVESHWHCNPLGIFKLFILVAEEVKSKGKNEEGEWVRPEGLSFGGF